ncbi:hydroxymethylbilane synthase, partial [Tremellales sp. Uapishka_1]
MSTAVAVAVQPQTPTTFTLGTRKSNLALIQTQHVRSVLQRMHPGQEYDFRIETMSTIGDRNQMTPLHLLSPFSSLQPAKSLWTDELEHALELGQFDLIVHSLKDVPTTLQAGFEMACMLEREDPRDALVVKEGLPYKRLEDLPDGSVVGTGSVRRVAQLKRAFPKLVFEDMRGNLNTRLAKLDSPTSPFSALILAVAGLTRVSLSSRITCPLSAPTLMHAVSQGALGVEIRSGDERLRTALQGMGHWPTEWRCGAERGLLRVLEGGCSVPVGVESELIEGGDGEVVEFGLESADESAKDSPMIWQSGKGKTASLKLHACVTATDGSKHVLHTPKPVVIKSYREAVKWGEMCAATLRDSGAKEILDGIEVVRKEMEKRDMQEAMAESHKLK